MTAWKHLVVAIANPFAGRQMAIRKASEIAALCCARITLFHAFSMPYPLPDPAPKSTNMALQAAMEYRLKGLEKLAKPLRKKGVAVECVVEWDFPAHEAIVRHLLRSKPDLLIAESHRHGTIGRWLLANTDWELIRACPCPLWFVKSQRSVENPAILAAVDPLHAHAKPSKLDDLILDHAATLLANLGGTINVVHAYTAPLSSASSNYVEPFRIPLSQDRTQRFLSGIRSQVEQLARRHGLSASQSILKEGDPVTVISAVAEKKSTDVLVMGAVSRHELKRIFIGSTAEKLIDKVRCDLLIVKPALFRTAVPKQSASTRLHLKASNRT
jgi:universal stress protein E